ncbi:MAG TPA: hypothetical protein VMT66_10585 [Steroidobacteraceae bacterium]|nr:hypothetical protein [Steroidobacteraceae bacterium]
MSISTTLGAVSLPVLINLAQLGVTLARLGELPAFKDVCAESRG